MRVGLFGHRNRCISLRVSVKSKEETKEERGRPFWLIIDAKEAGGVMSLNTSSTPGICCQGFGWCRRKRGCGCVGNRMSATVEIFIGKAKRNACMSHCLCVDWPRLRFVTCYTLPPDVGKQTVVLLMATVIRLNETKCHKAKKQMTLDCF